MVTRALAKELGPQRIRVNSVDPGLVDTEGTRDSGVIGSDFEREFTGRTPLGRTGSAGDIAPVVLFLASEQAGWVTGELLWTSGGLR